MFPSLPQASRIDPRSPYTKHHCIIYRERRTYYKSYLSSNGIIYVSSSLTDGTIRTPRTYQQQFSKCVQRFFIPIRNWTVLRCVRIKPSFPTLVITRYLNITKGVFKCKSGEYFSQMFQVNAARNVPRLSQNAPFHANVLITT